MTHKNLKPRNAKSMIYIIQNKKDSEFSLRSLSFHFFSDIDKTLHSFEKKE